MSLLQFPWNISVLIVGTLLYLSAREFLSARKYPEYFPERGTGFFHSILLLCFAGVFLFGVGSLFGHVKDLEANVPLYPGARYAPEREAIADRGQWIFVTGDTHEKVRAFYQTTADSLGYRLVSDKGTPVERILFTRGADHYFLTIVNEGGVRVLYFSEEGSVRSLSGN